MERKLKSYHYYYINNIFASLIHGFSEFVSTKLYPRSTETVISTYEKSVARYRKKLEANPDISPNVYPFISIDPSLDIAPDDVGGKFFYQYPQFEMHLSSKLFNPPIYHDDNVDINCVLSRYKGTFEIIVWCSSVYEALDTRVMTYQYFGGQDRIIEIDIESFIIIPDELYHLTYYNPYTKEQYILDWNNKNVHKTLIKNINQNKWCYPFFIKPQLRLTSVSDASNKYGGDELSEYKLNVSVDWECEVPSHMIFTSYSYPKFLDKNINEITFSIPGFYKLNDHQIIYDNKFITRSNEDGTVTKLEVYLDHVYNYVITRDDVASLMNTNNVYIPIDISIDNSIHYIEVYDTKMKLDRGYMWDLWDKDEYNKTVYLESVNYKSKLNNCIYIVIYSQQN